MFETIENVKELLYSIHQRDTQWCCRTVCNQCPLNTTALHSDLSIDTKIAVRVSPTLKQLGPRTIAPA